MAEERRRQSPKQEAAPAPTPEVGSEEALRAIINSPAASGSKRELSTDMLNLLRLMVGERSEATIGYGGDTNRIVSGYYTPSERDVRLWPYPINRAEAIDTAAHELSHAADDRAQERRDKRYASSRNEQYIPGMVGSNYASKFFEDIRTPLNKREQFAYQERLAKRAAELELPSSATGKLSEVNANAVADTVLNELGMKGEYSDKIQTLFSEFPEFGDWVKSGLAGRYRESPIMTEVIKQPSLSDRIVQLFK